MFGGASRFMFSSRKIFGSRLLEMSAPVIGRICSNSSLSKSVITRSQQLTLLTRTSTASPLSPLMTSEESNGTLVETGEKESDLASLVKEVADLISSKSGQLASLTMKMGPLVRGCCQVGRNVIPIADTMTRSVGEETS